MKSLSEAGALRLVEARKVRPFSSVQELAELLKPPQLLVQKLPVVPVHFCNPDYSPSRAADFQAKPAKARGVPFS